MSDQLPPLKDPFAIGDDERDARARRTPLPSGPVELPDPFAHRPRPLENTPAPAPIMRPLKRPALSDTPLARKPFTQALPAPVPVDRSDQPTVAISLNTSDQTHQADHATVSMPGFADLTGREMTMPATPVEGSTAARGSPVFGAEPTLLTGREMTMPATPAEGTTPAPVSPMLGAEPTLLTGREMTMPATPAEGSTPAPGGDAARASMHTPRTLPGMAGMAGMAGLTGMAQRTRSTSGKPSTGIRHSTTATSDDAWHYQGRAGQFTGQEWGDWDIGGILGEGGMGAVYRAKQKSLNRRVAVKVLSPNLAADLRLLQRFQLEARTASLLSSPNVVQVFAAGEFEGNHFFVMEYVEGRDLYDVMKERTAAGKPFTPDEAAGIVIQAAKGLVEAARIGVVHRDIKPPNLMVTNDGLVKVADFGIVKVMGEAVLTMTGQAVGTPSYVSPEQGRGESDIDQRSDLYSLGVVFYELLTGKKPFEASTPNAIIYQHCYGEPTLPRELNPAIDEKYQAVVLKCLQKKPENRYQNAAELIRDLEDIRSGRMLASALANYRNGTGADEAKRENMSWAQRHLLVLVGAIGVVVIAAGLGIWSLIAASNEDNYRRELELAQAKELFEVLKDLDSARAIPDRAEENLATYERLSVADQRRVALWRNKLRHVGELREKLKILDGTTLALDQRREAKVNLLKYQDFVGTNDTRSLTWNQSLEFLDKDERDARTRLRQIDQGDLNQTVVQGAQPLLAQLALLAGQDDPLVKRMTVRFADFATQRDRLIASLSALDGDVVITDAMRARMGGELEELKLILGKLDERITRWGAKLNSNAERIATLRGYLNDRVKDFDLPPVAIQLELSKDFAELKELVDVNDPQMQAWKGKFAAANAEIESLRKRLARLDQPNLLAVVEVEPLAKLLESLHRLVGDGDEQLLAWQERHKAAIARHGELRSALARLDNKDPLTLDEQRLLAGARELFASVGGSSQEQDANYQRRLNDERIQTQVRVERLRTLDQIAPLPDKLWDDLDLYAHQAGEQDADVRRWKLKRGRITDLTARLATLDTAAPLPEGVDALLDRLVEEVSAASPDVDRWRTTVVRIRAIAVSLAPLDQVESLPSGVVANLAEYGGLVGENDGHYRRWRTKVERVAALIATLDRALAAYSHSPAAHTQMQADYRELSALVSPHDPQVVGWAPRLAHLDGPPKPTWAAAHGRDDFGVWADLAITEAVTQRFRFVPSGGFVMGSPDNEAGHEADETQVRVTISAAFWLADTECTQALWRQVTGNDPARHRGDDRPVERVSWADAQAFIVRAKDRFVAPIRLPTEAEWEYAARAGGSGVLSSARADATALGTVAWYDANSGSTTKAVKLRFPNPIGLYDLHGNVWEWCQDRYAPYTTVPVNDPLGRDGLTCLVRGGSWGDPAATCRVANRAALRPDVRSAYVGLRLAADIEWAEGAPAPVFPPVANAPATPIAPSAAPVLAVPPSDVAPETPATPVESGVLP